MSIEPIGNGNGNGNDNVNDTDTTKHPIDPIYLAGSKSQIQQQLYSSYQRYGEYRLCVHIFDACQTWLCQRRDPPIRELNRWKNWTNQLSRTIQQELYLNQLLLDGTPCHISYTTTGGFDSSLHSSLFSSGSSESGLIDAAFEHLCSCEPMKSICRMMNENDETPTSREWISIIKLVRYRLNHATERVQWKRIREIARKQSEQQREQDCQERQNRNMLPTVEEQKDPAPAHVPAPSTGPSRTPVVEVPFPHPPALVMPQSISSNSNTSSVSLVVAPPMAPSTPFSSGTSPIDASASTETKGTEENISDHTIRPPIDLTHSSSSDEEENVHEPYTDRHTRRQHYHQTEQDTSTTISHNIEHTMMMMVDEPTHEPMDRMVEIDMSLLQEDTKQDELERKSEEHGTDSMEMKDADDRMWEVHDAINSTTFDANQHSDAPDMPQNSNGWIQPAIELTAEPAPMDTSRAIQGNDTDEILRHPVVTSPLPSVASIDSLSTPSSTSPSRIPLQLNTGHPLRLPVGQPRRVTFAPIHDTPPSPTTNQANPNQPHVEEFKEYEPNPPPLVVYRPNPLRPRHHAHAPTIGRRGVTRTPPPIFYPAEPKAKRPRLNLTSSRSTTLSTSQPAIWQHGKSTDSTSGNESASVGSSSRELTRDTEVEQQHQSE